MGLEDAEDFIELGIEGIDKLVDKHFDKIPGKYVDPNTYNMRRRNKDGKRKESADSHGDAAAKKRDNEAVQADNPTRENNKSVDDGRRARRRSAAERGAAGGAGAGAGAGADFLGYDPRDSASYSRARTRSPQPVGFGESASNLPYPYKTNSHGSYDPRSATRSPPVASYYPGSGYDYVDPPQPTAAAVYNYNPSGPGRPQPQYINPSGGGMQDTSGYNYLPPAPPPPIGSQFALDDDGDRRSRRRRSVGADRRSSSQPAWDGNRDGDDDYYDNRDRERRRERRRRSVSDERKSDRGKGGDDGQSKTGKVMLTILGAAVGGLAVKAAMDKLEQKGDSDGRSRVNGRAGGGRDGGNRRTGGGGGGRR